MPLMSLRAYAAHRKTNGLPGTSLQAVQNAIKGHRIFKDSSGLIDSEAADIAWEKNTDVGYRRATIEAADNPPVTTPQKSPPAGLRGNPGRKPKAVESAARAAKAAEKKAEAARPAAPVQSQASITYADARARREAAAADIAEMELKKLQGELLPLQEVERAWGALISGARGQLLAVPSKVANAMPHIAAADVAKIDQLIREALEGIANGRA